MAPGVCEGDVVGDFVGEGDVGAGVGACVGRWMHEDCPPEGWCHPCGQFEHALPRSVVGAMAGSAWTNRVAAAVVQHAEYLCRELLADVIERAELPDADDVKIGGETVRVRVERV